MGKTISFTGHRPNKLPGKYNWYDKRNIALMKEIRRLVLYLIEKEGVDCVITGGAIGIDQMAFKVVEKIKKEHPNIKQVLAVPFKNQDCKWLDEDKERYQEMLKEADEIVEVDKLGDYAIEGLELETYHPAKMQKRNEYMVDNSDIVIAVFDGTKGGTKNCYDYAKKEWKTVITINPIDF